MCIVKEWVFVNEKKSAWEIFIWNVHRCKKKGKSRVVRIDGWNIRRISRGMRMHHFLSIVSKHLNNVRYNVITENCHGVKFANWQAEECCISIYLNLIPFPFQFGKRHCNAYKIVLDCSVKIVVFQLFGSCN